VDPRLDIHHAVLVQRALDLLPDTFEESETEIVRLAQREQADIQFSLPDDDDSGAISLIGEPLLPVVRPDHLIDQIQIADLQPLFARSIETWAGFGGQDWPVHPVIGQAIVAPEFAR
jgi:hypothetical protein